MTQTTTSRRKFERVVQTIAVLAVASAGLTLAPFDPAGANHDGATPWEIEAEGEGRAAQLVVPVLDPDLTPSPLGKVTIDAGSAKTAVDSAGLNGGSSAILADSKGAPIEAISTTGIDAAGAVSETTAPPNDTHNAAIASFTAGGLVSSDTLASSSSAASSPVAAMADASIQVLHVPSTAGLLDLVAVHGAGSAEEITQTASATGNADVVSLKINAGVVSLQVDAILTAARASATGIAPGSPGGSFADTDCTTLKIQVTAPIPLTLPGPACNGASLLNLPGIVSITAPQEVTTATATEATAEVKPLIISVLGGQIRVELGRSFAHARLTHSPAQNLCRPPAPLTASGHARGDVVQINAVDPLVNGLATTDVVLSEARIDEAGIADDGTPTSKAAESDGWILRQQIHNLLLPPMETDRTEVGTFHAQATAPPNSSQTHAGLPPGLPETAHTTADASTVPAGSKSDPAAHATATTNHLPLSLPPLLGLDALTVASNAHATNSGNTTAASGHAGVESLDLNLLGGAVTLEVDVLLSDSAASATGSAGGATASSSYTIARLVLNGTELLNINSSAVPADLEVPGLVALRFGHPATSASANGQAASASVVPLTVELLGSGELIEISATEAAVSTPQAGLPSLTLCKDVDIHFDQKDGEHLATWGDDGRTIAPHQKLWYQLCVFNTGTGTATGVTITDVLQSDLRTISEPPGPPTEFNVSGNTLTTNPETIPGGGSRCRRVAVELRQETTTTLVTNKFQVTSNESGTLFSNTVTNAVVANPPNQPATFLTKNSQSYNSLTGVLTLSLRFHNLGGVTAKGALVDQATDLVGGWTNITPLPISIGDVPANGFVDFEFKARKLLATSFLFRFRETSRGPDGLLYAFDSMLGAKARAKLL